MKAHLRKIRISPKKANVVAGLVRGKDVVQALETLKFTPKKAADMFYKVILSAAQNAEKNNDMKRENLKIKEVIVNKGQVWKRFLPSTRGRALPLAKPTTHISVTLEKK
jgi:large subunit ribosomal protein L22